MLSYSRRGDEACEAGPREPGAGGGGVLWREPGGKARPRDASQKARQTGQAGLIRLDSLPVRTMVAAGLLLPVARGERGHEVVQSVTMAQPARMLARVRGRVGTL